MNTKTLQERLTSEFNETNLRGDPDDNTRSVTLTFDDGPNASLTAQLLETLRAENIKAGFFVLGSLVRTNPGKALIRQAFEAGHRIGNHSYLHRDLTRLSIAQIRDELRRTRDLICDVTTNDCSLFRPPYGAQNERVRSVVAELGLHTVLWNVDTRDWQLRDNRWVNTGIAQIRSRNNSVVLMHDIHRTTVERVPAFITRIRALGNVKFVEV